ncbi:phage tail protein [Turicimonas muris]|uniref:phage tail protein n=1 Tax=Turicimonas muris TaxID=1796652 RepID=UPI0025B23EFC|nr:phage tail protein [Turicimonas muris]
MTAVQTYWTSNAIQTAPDLEELTSLGYPTNGDPSKGIPPTLPGAAWFYRVDQLISALITKAGMEIDPTDTEQLVKAIEVFGRRIVPIGTTFDFPARCAIPEGFLICNGASLSRTEYPELFSVIGTTWGSDDPSTFKLLDAHHRFREGTSVLSEVGTYVPAGLPNSPGVLRVIDGMYGVFSAESSGVFSVSPGTNKIDVAVKGGYAGDNHANFSLSNGNSTYGASATVQPSALRSLVLIRSY